MSLFLSQRPRCPPNSDEVFVDTGMNCVYLGVEGPQNSTNQLPPLSILFIILCFHLNWFYCREDAGRVDDFLRVRPPNSEYIR